MNMRNAQVPTRVALVLFSLLRLKPTQVPRLRPLLSFQVFKDPMFLRAFAVAKPARQFGHAMQI